MDCELNPKVLSSLERNRVEVIIDVNGDLRYRANELCGAVIGLLVQLTLIRSALRHSPMPATSLPTINISDDLEMAHDKDPNSTTTTKARKAHLELSHPPLSSCFYPYTIGTYSTTSP
jgi:hypothetical protein